MRMREVYRSIKMKWAWWSLIICSGYVIYRQGWPAPAIEDLMLAVTRAQAGLLLGYIADTVHWRLRRPRSNDPDTQNMWRRTVFMVAGMFAVCLYR